MCKKHSLINKENIKEDIHNFPSLTINTDNYRRNSLGEVVFDEDLTDVSDSEDSKKVEVTEDEIADFERTT